MLLNLLSLSLILGLRQQVVLGRNAIQQRLFGCVIDGTHAVGTLKHNVLKVVGNTGIGAILCARPHHNGTKHLGLRVVFVNPNSHAIAKFKLLYIELCRCCKCNHACENG